MADHVYPLLNRNATSPARIREQVPCPRCGQGMRLMAIEPAPPAMRAELITYRCGICNYKEKHVRQAEVTR
jgi:C4-type Zn-finger protein